MNPTAYAALLNERLHAAGIEHVQVVYSSVYRYCVGMSGTGNATVLVHRPEGSSIPYFTAQRMTRGEVAAFVAGLCIAATCRNTGPIL